MANFLTSPESLRASQRRPGRKLLCSTRAGWRSLLVQTYVQPSFVDRYETLASPDFLIVLVERGRYDIESFSGGSWRKAAYRPGVAGITAPFTTNCLRWHSPSPEKSQVARAYVPASFFEEAAEEFRKAGTRPRPACSDTLAFRDPQVAITIHSLVAAVEAGLPEIYAETAARHLATHLVARAHGWRDAYAAWPGKGDLTDNRLRRAFDYMVCNFAEQLTIEQLAKEAGISRFHFCRLFKLKTGLTPHQHLSRLRIANAQKLLRTTERSIAEIVAECGYAHSGHFAAAFSRITGRTPSQYRQVSQGPESSHPA